MYERERIRKIHRESVWKKNKEQRARGPKKKNVRNQGDILFVCMKTNQRARERERARETACVCREKRRETKAKCKVLDIQPFLQNYAQPHYRTYVLPHINLYLSMRDAWSYHNLIWHSLFPRIVSLKTKNLFPQIDKNRPKKNRLFCAVCVPMCVCAHVHVLCLCVCVFV